MKPWIKKENQANLKSHYRFGCKVILKINFNHQKSHQSEIILVLLNIENDYTLSIKEQI